MKLHLPVLLRKAVLACFSVAFAYSMSSGSTAAADLTLGGDDSLAVDCANPSSITDLAGGTLTLAGGTELRISNCGTGDGKTYTLLTSVSGLLDDEGNIISLDSSNNAIANYFDTTQPGTGFWADAILVLTDDDTLQLVRYSEPVKDVLTITSRKTTGVTYLYYTGVKASWITSGNDGGAIYGGTSGAITLNNNGSVTFGRNLAKSYGGAIYGNNTITLSNNGSVEFDGNKTTATSGGGGAIYGGTSGAITLNNNGSVTFSGNAAKSYGGAIYGNNTITLNNNGSVEFDGNKTTAISGGGGAIYGGTSGAITLNNNGSVTFSGNAAEKYGGAIYGERIELSNNGSVLFNKNTAFYGGAIYGERIELSNNGSVLFNKNTASCGGAIYGDQSVLLNGNGNIEFTETSTGGAIGGQSVILSNNGNIKFESSTSTTSTYEHAIWYHTHSTAEIALRNNNFVSFIGFTSAIYVKGNINVSENVEISFAQNSAQHGGAIYIEEKGIVEFSKNHDILFSENAAWKGGAIYHIGDIDFFENTGIISFASNGSIPGYTSSGTSESAFGGAIYAGGVLSFTDNQEIVFESNKSDLSASYYGYDSAGGATYSTEANFINNSKVVFSNNSNIRRSSSYENDSYGGAVYVSNNLLFDNNDKVSFSGNYTEGDARGGAIYAGTEVQFINNGIIIFENNRTISGTDDSYNYGGAIYTQKIDLVNNQKISFKGNYEKNAAGNYRLRSLYIGNTSATTHDGSALFSSAYSDGVEFFDPFYINGGLRLNEKYTTADDVEIPQIGDIVISALYTDDALYYAKGNIDGSATELMNSKTSEVIGVTHLYDGRLRVEDGAIFEAKGGIQLHSSVTGKSTPTLYLRNSSLRGSTLLLEQGTLLELTGKNTATFTTFQLDDSGSVTFHMNGENADFAVLRLSGAFEQQGALTLNISFNDSEAEAGLYKLLTVTSIADDSLWTTSNVTVNGLDGYVVSFDDLEWKDNTLYLNYNGTPGTGGATTPTLLIATWTNEAGDGLWNGTSLNWEQEEVDYAYVDGVQVVFGDEGAGTVTLVGDIAPSSVLVDSAEDYTWNADATEGGKLTGDMTLTKKGEGTLSINTENDYTGGTQILGGKVVAGTATALGSGVVSLNNAGLEIIAENFANVLTTAGVSSIVVKDDGSLKLCGGITNAVNGTLTLSGKVDVSGIGELTKLDATLIDVNGNAGESGFARTEGYTLQVVQGGKVLGAGAQLEHKDLPTELTLVLGENGLATAGATTDFTKYVVTGSHAVSVSEILKDVPQDSSLSSIEMSGGTLLVDAATDALAATGGTVTVNKAVTLGGTMSGGMLMAQAGEIAATLSGNTAVVVSGGVILSGSNTHSGGVMLNGGALTLKHAQALGSGPLVTSGTSSLVIDSGVELSLGQAISNSGSLSVSGKIQATGALNTEAATHVDVNGNSGASGFAKDALEWVQIVNGGTTVNAGAEISHNSATKALVLGSDGRAIGGGVIHHDEYLLTGTGVADVQRIMDAAGSELTSIKMQGGMLTVNADTGALLSAEDGIILLTDGGTIGSGSSVSGVDIKASGGSIAAILTGSNTLEGIGDFALNAVIANNGTLVLSGNIKADALSLVEETPSTFVDVNGNSGTSGFSKSALVSVQLTSGTGTTIDGGVTLTHKDATETLVLGKDGKAGYGGVINYTNYLLDGESDSASVSDIIADAGDALTSITVQKGTLTVDAVSKHITATGGSVVLDGGVLNGTLSGTALTLKNGSLDAASITGGSVSGENYLMGAVLNVSGDVAVSGSFNASALQLNTTNATRIDVNGASGASGFLKAEAHSVQVFNGGTLDIASGTTVKHGGIDLLLGSNGYATAGGGITWSEYLLTGDDSAAASAIYQEAIDNGYNGAVSITQTGGTLTVTADAEVTTTAGSINLTGGTLTGTISGATLSVTGGKLTATLSGTNTLSGANKLINVLDNDGMLNISGTLDVTQLGDLTDHGETYTKGGSNGFKTSSAYSIKLVDNSGTINSTATIKHGEIDNFVLGSDGVARAEGSTFYDTYYITSGHEAAVDDIRGESGNQLALIDMSGGTLNANADAAVKVMGGEVKLTAGELSGSISGATLGITGGKLTATLSGSNTLSGANKLINVLDNDGLLNISGTLDVTQLGALTDHGVTYTKGGSNGFKTSSAYSIKLVDNSGSLNNTATIKHGDIDNFVLGSDGVATAAGTTDYKTYYITFGHAAAVDAIRGESGHQLTLVDMSGGTLNANADAAVKVTGGAINLTAGTLSGSISGATLGITGGKLTATLSGSNTLSGANKLYNVLDNDGMLNISGTLDVTQLGALTDHGETYTKGGSNGFKTSSAYSIKLVDNSGSLNSTAIIQHGDIDNFVLGSDGVARAEGTTFYDTYYITSGHAAAVDAIRGESGNQLTLIDMSGGSLDANADATVKVMDGEVKLTAGELSGSISGATLSVSGGTLAAELSGNNTLVGDGYVLNSKLKNTGTLTLRGSFSIGSGLTVQHTDAGYESLNGSYDATNGFARTEWYSVDIADGDTADANATITYDGKTLKLGNDGVATRGGEVDYTMYYLNSGELSTKTLHDKVAGADIMLKGGTLTVETQSTVTATGGAIKLVENGVLNGSLTNTNLTLKAGTVNATISGGTVTGDAYALNEILQLSGNVRISGSFVADALTLTTIDAKRVDVVEGNSGNSGFLLSGGHSVQIINGGTLTIDAGTSVTYGGINLTLGTDGYATTERTQGHEYLLIGNDTVNVGAILGADSSATIKMQGGTLNVDEATDALTATAGTINLNADVELGGTISGATINASKGTLAATLNGNNTLVGDGYVLNSKLKNTGTLTLSGSFSIGSELTVQHTDAGYESLNGSYDATNGFARTEWYSVDIADGDTADANATITYDGKTLKLGNDGVATRGGEVDYTMYYLNSGELSTKTLHDKVAGADIMLKGGTLTVETQSTVTATGGAIKLVENGVLNGSLTNTNLTLKAGTVNATISGGTVTGDAYALNEILQLSGNVSISGSFVADALTLNTIDAKRVDVVEGNSGNSGFLLSGGHSVQIINGGTLSIDAGTSVTYGGINLTLGTDGYARSTGGTNYGEYLLTGSDKVSTNMIHTGEGAGALVRQEGGQLRVNDATEVKSTSGEIILAGATLSGEVKDTRVTAESGSIAATLSGITAVTVTDEVILSGNNTHSGVTTLADATLTITHANALGSGDVVTTGDSKLVVSGVTMVLGDSIANTGELTLKGSIDASGLTLNRTEEGRLALNGTKVSLAESGFARGVEYSVQIVEGGTTVNDGASISHKDYLSRTQLVLGEDGYARAGGAVDYTHYFLTGGDSAVVSEIADVATQHQETLTGVTMDSGELEVDRSIEVNATGGSICITDDAVLSGTVEDTAVSTAADDYSSEISALLKGDTTLEVNGGAVTVSGDNSYSGGTVVNGGALFAGHDNAFGAGDVAVNDATLDLNLFSIANKVRLNGNSTLGHADGASHIVLGGGSGVNFRDGFTLSSGKVLDVAAGGATYTGALTLGGGCIELDGKLTVQGNVTFESGTQTTLDISGWNGVDDGEVLVDFGSSASGYTEDSLKLSGIAGEWKLNFDAATGVLTLVEVKVEPQPEPEFAPSLNRNQQVVYDTIKDIMGEGNPGGLLGELGKEVTGTRDEEKLQQLLDELGGAEYATLLSGQQAAARGHMRRLRGEMGCGHLLAGSKTRAYIEAYNHRSEVDGDAHGRGYELNESGGQFALEFLGEDSVSGGFAVAAGRSKLQPDGGMTQKSDNTYMDAFVMHRDGAYTGKFSLGVGVHKYDLDRRVAGNAVNADASGTSVNFMHESAYGVSLSESHSVQVFGAVESSFNKLGAFREKGAGTASLQVESQDAWVTTLSLGARYLYSFAALESAPAATLSLQGGLELDFGDTESVVEMNFEGARARSFRQSGAERDTFGYNLGASLHLPVSAKAAIYASGDAVLRGNSYEVNANVGLQMAF